MRKYFGDRETVVDKQALFSEQFGFFGWRASSLNRINFSAIYSTETLRKLHSPDSQTKLREDGSNWASVIYEDQKTKAGQKKLTRIVEMMRVVLPDLQKVEVEQTKSWLMPTFVFGSTGTAKPERMFDPTQLSDGTLRIYCLLLALYQEPAPPVLVIEEPEQGVHPGVLTMLVDAFKEVAETTQIIVTTHSPQLVRHFEPRQIRVVTMKDGFTQVSPIDPKQAEAVAEGLMGLDEFMSAEGLQPALSM